MLNGRVNIDFFVGMFVVVSMGGGPPERTTLHRAVAEDGKKKLAKARCLEGAMGKVAVVEAGDREHADEVEKDGGDKDSGVDSDPENGKAAEVEKNERQGAFPIDLIRQVGGIGCFLTPVVRIKPLADHPEGCGKNALLGIQGRRHVRWNTKNVRWRMLLHAVANDRDESAYNRNLAVDIFSGVPKILVEGDLAVFVEADLAHADRVNGCSATQFGGTEDHFPANIVVRAGAGLVEDSDLEAGHRFGGGEEVFFDLLRAIVRDDGIVEIGLWRVGLCGILFDVILVANVLQEVGKGGNGRCFFGCSGGGALLARLGHRFFVGFDQIFRAIGFGRGLKDDPE